MQSQRRQPPNSPGRWFQPPPEEISLNLLFRQILFRIRRAWIAFRFQVNRYTLGVFRERTALKLGTLGIVGYMLLFSDRELWLFSQSESAEMISVGPVETALELSDRSRGETIDWRAETGRKQVQSSERKKEPAPKKGNDFAPLRSEDLRDDQSRQYITRFSKIAVQEMKKYGIPASISLAQGLIESRYGTSKLAVNNNNHFGMKCFSKNCRKGHCSNYSDDHHKDFFRIFKNPWESWRAHSLMLANGRYTRLKKYGKNYRQWAHGLEQLGYATDRTYAEKLIGVIERYDLHRFD